MIQIQELDRRVDAGSVNKGEKMGYSGMYKKSAPKKATKAKKPAVKKKKAKKPSKY